VKKVDSERKDTHSYTYTRRKGERETKRWKENVRKRVREREKRWKENERKREREREREN
jgi:hypothetical protein